MRILVTNDDGIHAPGLKVLEGIAKTLTKDVWVVAPDSEQSGASHSLTLSMPLRLRKMKARRFAVAGTPTDCVMMAVTHIIEGKRPDLVLSGVNRGGNLGEDVTYSGTVAAAIEGTLLRVPSVAFSQGVTLGKPTTWATAAHYAPKILRKLLDAGWPADVLINVNFPDLTHDAVTGVTVCPVGRRDESELIIDPRLDPRGTSYFWLGFRKKGGKKPPANTDLGVIARGGISVTPLHVDFTHHATLTALKRKLK